MPLGVLGSPHHDAVPVYAGLGLVMSDSLWPHGLYTSSGFPVHGIFQARILEWVAIFYSRGSSQPTGIKPASPESPALAGGFFTTEPCCHLVAVFINRRFFWWIEVKHWICKQKHVTSFRIYGRCLQTLSHLSLYVMMSVSSLYDQARCSGVRKVTPQTVISEKQ